MKLNLKSIILEELQNLLTEQAAAFPKYNDRGEPVKALQKALIDKKFLRIGAPTGWFGPLTKKAIADLQRASKLTATGIIDNTTQKVINSVPTKTPVVPQAATAPTPAHYYYKKSAGIKQHPSQDRRRISFYKGSPSL